MTIVVDLRPLVPYGGLIVIDIFLIGLFAIIFWGIYYDSKKWAIRIAVASGCILWIINLIEVGIIVIKT